MTDQTENSLPKYTVSGNHMRVWRLDADGNPTGEPVEYPGPVSFTLDACDVIDADIDGDTVTLDLDPNQTRLDSFSTSIEFAEVDPAILALLTGQGTPPEEMLLMPVTRKMRFKWWLTKVKRWLRNEEWRNLRGLRWLP